MVLTEKIKKHIIKHSEEQIDKECCGLIYINDSSFEPFVERCENISENTTNFFTINPVDYLNVSKMGKIVATYHSHHNENDVDFSDLDIINAENFNLIYVLYVIKEQKFKIYKPNGYKLPYVNRQYIVGYIDCFSLVKDYYKNEKNIEIEDLEHEYRFVDNKPNHPDNTKVYDILPNHFYKNGFNKVDNLKKYDIILMKTNTIPSPVHAAVYMGENLILHHPFKSYSLIETYRAIYKNWTTHILRHKLLS